MCNYTFIYIYITFLPVTTIDGNFSNCSEISIMRFSSITMRSAIFTVAISMLFMVSMPACTICSTDDMYCMVFRATFFNVFCTICSNGTRSTRTTARRNVPNERSMA